MRANTNCYEPRSITVFLNGVEQDGCMEADEATGDILVACKDGAGKYIREQDAERGTLLADGFQVMRQHGKVTLKLGGPLERHAHLRECIEESFFPLEVTVKAKTNDCHVAYHGRCKRCGLPVERWGKTVCKK